MCMRTDVGVVRNMLYSFTAHGGCKLHYRLVYQDCTEIKKWIKKTINTITKVFDQKITVHVFDVVTMFIYLG